MTLKRDSFLSKYAHLILQRTETERNCKKMQHFITLFCFSRLFRAEDASWERHVERIPLILIRYSCFGSPDTSCQRSWKEGRQYCHLALMWAWNQKWISVFLWLQVLSCLMGTMTQPGCHSSCWGVSPPAGCSCHLCDSYTEWMSSCGEDP